MPARDLYHDTVRAALVKDGWTITDDPLTLQIGKKDLFVDLGAKKLLAAEKGEQKMGKILLERGVVQLIIFNNEAEEIVRWFP